MIEYLYNCIRATSGQDIAIAAEITDTNGDVVTSMCHVMLYSPEEELIATHDGVYDEENSQWIFTIPAEATKGLQGRYWYCLCHHESNLCFKQPLYLVF